MNKEKLYKLINFNYFEWRTLMVLMLLLPLVALMLNLIGYKNTKKILGLFIPVNNYYKNSVSLNRAYSIVRIANIKAKYSILNYGCLEKAIAIWWLMSRHGLFCEIKFGVLLKSVDRFIAHAWVDYCGINLTDVNINNNDYLEFLDCTHPSLDF